MTHIARTRWHVQEVESNAPPKIQHPTELGDNQNIEKKHFREGSIYFPSFRPRLSVFVMLDGILEGPDNFRRKNRFPREIFLQIQLFGGPRDKKLRKKQFVLRKPCLCEPYPRAIASHLGVYVREG